jgi:hypothetical protein
LGLELGGGFHVCVLDWEMPKVNGIDLSAIAERNVEDKGPAVHA